MEEGVLAIHLTALGLTLSRPTGQGHRDWVVDSSVVLACPLALADLAVVGKRLLEVALEGNHVLEGTSQVGEGQSSCHNLVQHRARLESHEDRQVVRIVGSVVVGIRTVQAGRVGQGMVVAGYRAIAGRVVLAADDFAAGVPVAGVLAVGVEDVVVVDRPMLHRSATATTHNLSV